MMNDKILVFIDDETISQDELLEGDANEENE
jgi:hypothetical protein